MSEAQVKQWVRDELKRILDTGLMYTDQITPSTAKQSAPTTTEATSQPQTKPKETVFATIKELHEGSKKVNINGKIVETNDVRYVGDGEVMDTIIADETATIKLVLWNNDIGKVELGSQVQIVNGYVTEYKGELQLNVGKWGKLSVVKES